LSFAIFGNEPTRRFGEKRNGAYLNEAEDNLERQRESEGEVGTVEARSIVGLIRCQNVKEKARDIDGGDLPSKKLQDQ
jgi:hypothetical protein